MEVVEGVEICHTEHVIHVVVVSHSLVAQPLLAGCQAYGIVGRKQAGELLVF